MKKTVNIIMFVGSLGALIISAGLFLNMGIYADEFNTSPAVVCGGELMLYLNWLRLFILALMTVISGIKLFEK